MQTASVGRSARQITSEAVIVAMTTNIAVSCLPPSRLLVGRQQRRKQQKQTEEASAAITSSSTVYPWANFIANFSDAVITWLPTQSSAALSCCSKSFSSQKQQQQRRLNERAASTRVCTQARPPLSHSFLLGADFRCCSLVENEPKSKGAARASELTTSEG